MLITISSSGNIAYGGVIAVQKKKKLSFWKILLYLFLYMLLYCVLVSLFIIFCEIIKFTGDSEVLVCLLLPIPILIVIPCLRKKRPKNELEGFSDAANCKEEIKIPRTKKGREKAVTSLLLDISSCVALANKAKNFSTFLMWYDEIIEKTRILQCFEGKYNFYKVMCGSNPTEQLQKFEGELQWHLRDKIEDQADDIIKLAKGDYRNNKEQTKKDCEEFRDNIRYHSYRFDDDTKELANRKLQELQQKLGIPLIEQAPEITMSNSIDTSLYMQYGGVEGELLNADLMDGHRFESWCADLLRKNGYNNVQVTPGSGDQGIDVLAEKNGVNFAIQCKCYSSDLGNTPVQEAHAGKDFYNCDVAVVMTNRHFTKGARDLAEKTRTRLWDRETLRNMLEAQNATQT